MFQKTQVGSNDREFCGDGLEPHKDRRSWWVLLVLNSKNCMYCWKDIAISKNTDLKKLYNRGNSIVTTIAQTSRLFIGILYIAAVVIVRTINSRPKKNSIEYLVGQKRNISDLLHSDLSRSVSRKKSCSWTIGIFNLSTWSWVFQVWELFYFCLLYTSDAADE